MTVQNKTTKFISALLIISILLPSVLLSTPKKAKADAWGVPTQNISEETASWLSKALHAIGVPSTVTDTGLHIKDWAEFLIRQALMAIAKAFLAKMTQATINWINSDFHGSPLFLENPESFFKDIAKSQIKFLVDMIGYDDLRFPFGRQTALNIIASYKSQLATNAQYTLSKVGGGIDLPQFRNNFNYGGWNGFLINTQYPQNNYLGFNMIVGASLGAQLTGTLQAPAEKVQSLLQQGMGFLSPQTCPSNPNYNNGVNEFVKPRFRPAKLTLPENVNEDSPEAIDAIRDWQAENDQAEYDWADPEGPNVCPGGLVSTTPGSVAGNQIMMAMGSNFRQSELGAALGNSLSAIFDALINKFLEKGLNALSGAVNPKSGKDNWSYEGQSLSGNLVVDSGTAIDQLDIPDNLSIRVGTTTSTFISGGSGSYRIKAGAGPNTDIATATIATTTSAPKLTITGIAPKNKTEAPRSTTVTIEDAIAKPEKVAPVTVNITVFPIGALVVMQTNCEQTLIVSTGNFCISTDTNNPHIATVEGGTGTYRIKTFPDEGIAVASLRDGNLIISGVNKGETSVVIMDSDGKDKTIKIKIESMGELNILPQNIQLGVNEKMNAIISGGTPPYTKEVSDTSKARVDIVDLPTTIYNETTKTTSNATVKGLEITGRVVGTTSIIITDSSSPAKKAGATVSVTGPTITNAPLGTCVIYTKVRVPDAGDPTTTTTIPRIRESDCQSNLDRTTVTHLIMKVTWNDKELVRANER